jgi:(2Fe-2S) ferredoxin
VGPYRTHVFVCTHGDYCPFDGAAEVHRALKEQVAARGLKDRVRINKSGCFDQCGNGPMVAIYPDDVWYGGVTVERALRILEEHIVGGRAVEELRYRGGPGACKNPARMAAIRAAGASGAGPAGPEQGRP